MSIIWYIFLLLSSKLNLNMPDTKKNPKTTLRSNAPVTCGAPSKRSTSGTTTRSQLAARRGRLDSSSAAEADVPPTGQGTDMLTRAISWIVDAVLRSLPHSSTVMLTDNAHDNLEHESLADDPVDLVSLARPLFSFILGWEKGSGILTSKFLSQYHPVYCGWQIGGMRCD